MIGKSFSQLAVSSLIRVCHIGLWVISTGLIVMVCLRIFSKDTFREDYQVKKEVSEDKLGQEYQRAEKKLDLPYKSDYEGFFFEDLKSQLSYLGQNLRPDKKPGSAMYFISLKEGKMIEEVNPQTKLYLKYTGKDLEFSKSPTPLWVKVAYLEQDKIKLEAGIWVADEESGVVIQRKKKLDLFVNESSSEPNFLDETSQDAFKALSSFASLGKDKIYESYGGKDYEELKTRSRLQIQSSVIYIKKGDLLVYKEGKWSLAQSSSAETLQYPIAVCIEDSSKGIEIKAWDPSGVISKTFKAQMITAIPIQYKMEEILKNINVRGFQSFTCKLQQKTHLLRVGDWLVKSSDEWKVLNHWEDIQRYLSYQLVGELFIIDEIEKKQGISILKGTLFDKMRISAQKVKIPLTASRKQKRRKSNKKSQACPKLDASTEIAPEGQASGSGPGDEELLRVINPKQYYVSSL